MFDHVSIGVSDLKRAGRFYDAVMKPLDVTRLSDGEGALGYGEKSPGLWILAAPGIALYLIAALLYLRLSWSRRSKLALAVDGVPFPNLKAFAGWRAVGARQELIGNRDASLVVYSKDGKRLGYVIVFEECDHQFSKSLAADTEAKNGCRVRFIRGYS